jgi:hypothetical protein
MLLPSLPDVAAVLLKLAKAAPPDLDKAPPDAWSCLFSEVAALLGIESVGFTFLFQAENIPEDELDFLRPPSRRAVREAAAEARAKLDAHLQEICSSLATSGRDDPALVVRQKYQTTHKLIRFADRVFRWVRGKMAVVAASGEKQDVVAIARDVQRTTKVVDKPAPSAELVANDLQEAACALDPVFTDALEAAARYCLLGWLRVEVFLRVGLKHPTRLRELWLEAWGATVDFAEVTLAPAKLLRSAFTQQIGEISAEDRSARRIVGPEADPPATGTPGAAGAPEREAIYRFEQVGELWAVSFGEGEKGNFSDLTGMGHLHRLLQSPHRPLSALTLDGGAARGNLPIRTFRDSHEAKGDKRDSAGLSNQDAADRQTLDSVEAKMKELIEEIAAAKADNDTAALQRAQGEFYKLEAYLLEAKGWQGKVRQVGSAPAAEKARVNVRAALDRAYKKMGNGKPPLRALVAYLKAHICTEGTSYVYRPDPSDRRPWQL